MVMPSGSPVLIDAAAMFIAQPSPENPQACGHPENEDDCAFCLRSEVDFSNHLVTRDEDGRWVSSWRRRVDLSGVQRRLFQPDRGELTPERPEVEDVDSVMRDILFEDYEELTKWLVEDTPRVGDAGGEKSRCIRMS